jgi:sugar lactone lactonase YvrE
MSDAGEPADAARPAPLPDAAPDDATAPALPPDAPVGVDAAPDQAARDLGPDAFVPPAGCGTATANIAGINNADGVVVDTDGTVYFLTDDATNSYVGRILPGPNQLPDQKWLPVYGSPVTWGLALDPPIGRLYVVVVSGQGAMLAFDDIKGTPRGNAVVTGITNPNDAVVAADGTLYYSVQGDRYIYRRSRDGKVAGRVTTVPLGSVALSQAPSGVTIDPFGDLIVGLEHGGALYKVALGGTLPQAPVPYGKWTGWANGMTFDRRDRLLIGIYDDENPRDVVRIEADGKVTTITSGGRFSSLAFGRGTLDCRDLYVAEPFGPMRRVRINDAF